MERIEQHQGDITILEEWGVIDKWWTAEPIRHEYVEVIWNNHRITFRRILPEKIWRIVNERR